MLSYPLPPPSLLVHKFSKRNSLSLSFQILHKCTHTIFYSIDLNWTSNQIILVIIYMGTGQSMCTYDMVWYGVPLTLDIVSFETVSICATCGIRMQNQLISGYLPIGPFLHPINFATHFRFAHHKNDRQIKFHANAHVHARTHAHTHTMVLLHTPLQIVWWECDTNFPFNDPQLSFGFSHHRDCYRLRFLVQCFIRSVAYSQ